MSLDRATPAQFSSSPLLEDPYESIFVEVTIISIQCPFTMMYQSKQENIGSDNILPRLEKVIFRVLEKVYLPEGTFRFTFQSDVYLPVGICKFSKAFTKIHESLAISNLSFDNHHQAGTVIAFYNGVRVEASDNRYPDEYRLKQ